MLRERVAYARRLMPFEMRMPSFELSLRHATDTPCCCAVCRSAYDICCCLRFFFFFFYAAPRVDASAQQRYAAMSLPPAIF